MEEASSIVQGDVDEEDESETIENLKRGIR